MPTNASHSSYAAGMLEISVMVDFYKSNDLKHLSLEGDYRLMLNQK
jgi:hypothetical protein